MSGVIPRNMRLRQLRYMYLGHNKFSGTLPDELGTESVRLRHLFLDHNDFLGTVPESYVVAGQGRINTLYLNDNKLSGPFPGNGTLFQVSSHGSVDKRDDCLLVGIRLDV